MKILFISRSINPPWTEGVKNTIKLIIESITNHKFIVPTKEEFSFNLENVEELPISKEEESFKVPLKSKINLFKNLILNKEIDAYHLFGMPKKHSSTLIKYFSKKRNKKTIQTLSNIEDKESKKLYFADKIIVMSKHSQNKLKELEIDSEVIYPSIDLEEFTNIKDYRKELNIKKERVILYAGDLDKDTTQNLINIILNSPKKIKFIIAVRNKTKEIIHNKQILKNKVKEQNLENIIFVKRADMPKLINTSDIVIFPVKKITSKLDIPMILLEALALKKPILVSNNPLLKEILTQKAGYSLEIEKFPEEIKRLTQKEINSLSKNCQKIIKENFDKEVMIKKYKEIYDQL
jgi:glycosyltransferase involved in cell wall biosynthesis